MKSIFKRKLSLVILAFVLCSLAVGIALAKNESNPITYSDHQRFRGPVTMNGPNAVNPIDVKIGPNADIEFNSGVASYMTSLSSTNYVNGTGFSITSPTTNGNIVLISMTGITDYFVGGKTKYLGVALSGTTVNLPTITEDMDGWELTIIKSDSGTSEIVPYAAGLPIGYASGVTPGDNVATYLLNAQGDSITLIADYASAVSWWIKSAVIH